MPEPHDVCKVEEAPVPLSPETSNDIITILNITRKQILAGFKRILAFPYLKGRKLKIEKTAITKYSS